uniref:Integrin alpha-PS4 n=1 Tax=Ceratitis capitata TaxID=7213 RepID=W8C0U6_CERCA
MFGLGLSKSLDLYGNDQNCLAIGAPNADTVFLYRSYPVVKINASIKALNAYLPLNTKEVRIDICVNILTNFTRVKNQEVLLDLKADERIDTGECIRNKTFLAKPHATCFDCLAKITSTEASVFVPMLMELSYRLKNDAKTASETDFCENCAAVDPTLPNLIKITIQYLHDCEGSVCVADLQLQNVDIPPKITLGSTKVLPLKYKIKNVGENALYTKLIIRSTPILPIAQTPAECIMELNSDWLICSLAQRQAFTGNTTLEVEVSLDLNEVVGIDKLTIEAHVSSAGDEKTPADNSVVNTIELITAAEIWITETTSNEITEILNEEKRYRVKRYFELTNNGPSSLGGLNILSAALPIGYVDDKGIEQDYVSNITAQVYIKDFIYPPMSFNTTQSLSHEELNTTELLNVYHIPENRTTFLSCQPNGETNVKRLCAFGNFPLTSTLRSAQKLALKLQYEIQWHNVENLMLRDREYLAHVAMVDLQPGAKLNGLLSTKKRLKAALFVKINKKSTLWIYVVAAIGGLLLLVGIVLLLKKFGFFKRLTREAMEENYKDKEEKALMKDQLDKVADDIDMELDENVECN